jgi:hypothetical protein
LQKNTQTSITGSSVFAPTVFLGNQCSSINVSFGANGGIIIRNVGGVITTSFEVGNLSKPEQVLVYSHVVCEQEQHILQVIHLLNLL